MPDAYALQMARRDRCKQSTPCPTCSSPPGSPCYAIVKSNGHVYSPAMFQRVIEHAAMSTGKTMTQMAILTGVMRHPDWGRELGGLHKARWQKYERRDAVTRLGEIVD